MTVQRRDPLFVLNRNEGTDTLHIDPVERCNVDDIDDRDTIDEETYLRMKDGRLARLCKHCHKEPQS